MPEPNDTQTSEDKGVPKEPPKLTLAPSALFYTANCPMPRGIRARDLGAFVQGLVEEHSPLPLDQTSWGFLLDNRDSKRSHLLYYAGARDFVFKNPSASTDLTQDAVMPGLAVIQGLRFSQDTWLFLLEEECLSAIFFVSGSTVPNRVFSRFLTSQDSSPEALFEQRAALLKRTEVGDGQDVLPGLVRVGQLGAKARKGIVFPLERLEEPDGEWTSWKKTEFKKPTRLLAADVRDHTALSSHTDKRDTGRRLGQIAAIIGLCIVGLGALEFFQTQRQGEAVELQTLAEEQEPLVQRLQDIETMTKSLKSTFESEFLPFRWLMVLNEGRPETISFTSFAMDEAGAVTVNGRAPEVKSLNEYVETLTASPKFDEINLANIQTDKDGAGFTIRAQIGDLDATPPEPEPTEEVAATPEATNAQPEAAPAAAPQS